METESLTENLMKITETVSLARNADDFFNIACEIIFLLKDGGKEKLKKEMASKRRTPGKRAVYDELLHGVFSNESFNSSLFQIMNYENTEKARLENKHSLEILNIQKVVEIKTLSEDERDKLYKENRDRQWSERRELAKTFILNNTEAKKTVHYGLYLSFLMIVFVGDSLTEENITYIRTQLSYLIRQVTKFQNYKFHRLEILRVITNISFSYEYDFKKPYHKETEDKILNNYLHASRNILGVALIVLSQHQLISLSFKEMSSSIKKSQGSYRLYREINRLCSKMKFVEASLKEYKKRYREIFDNDHLDNFYNQFIKKTEENSFFVLRAMTMDLKSIPQENAHNDNILSFIEKSKDIKTNISSFFQKNFSAFSKKNTADKDWSNKIFLISLKSLAVFETLIGSKDEAWKIDVFLNEYIIWMEEVNKILNKYSLEDDWDKIEKFLVQENTNVEWKSTFYTSTETEYRDEKTERALARKVLNLIVTPMLGMMNTDGGVILVGVVENAKSIRRKDLKEHLVEKAGYNFFNISYELKKKGKDMDSVKREIQDLLFARTGFTAEKFNNLWNIEVVEIRQNDEVATIYKILVKKADEFIYEYEKKSDSGMRESISLIKRADGRTIYVDPRDYLR